MPLRKFKDWRGWLDGLRTNLFKTIGTTGITLLGTNGLDQLGVHGVSMSWKTALCQFGVHIGFEICAYLKNKPDPDIITVQEETAFTQKSNE